MAIKMGRKSADKNSDEYGTPRWLYNLLDEEFGFNGDVCASSKNHKHERYFTKRTNALMPGRSWFGVNFCNPPYSKILPWFEKAVEERDQSDDTTVFVVKLDPSTQHGQLAAQEMDEIRVLTHRIKFVGADYVANFPVAVMVCRPRLYTRKTDARILYVNYQGEEK